MYDSMLVPLDGSPFAEHALPIAQTLASRAQARVELLYVYPPHSEVALEASPFFDEELSDKIKTRQRTYLDGIVQKLGGKIKNVQVGIDEGEVAETIKRRVEKSKAKLVVMSTHARGAIGRFFLGSVADELVRTLPVPLLLVRPHEAAVDLSKEVSFRHILLPLDGSPFAEQIIEPAIEMARLMGADITLLRVVQPVPAVEPVPIEMGVPPMYHSMVERLDEVQQGLVQQAQAYLDNVASRLRNRVAAIQTRVVEAVPADEILRQALPANVDLIALATHGRRGLSRMVLGSVADKVIRGARVPVLVLRPKEG